MYHANTPFPVYDRDTWWSDAFNPIEYGRDFDFNRPFFEQFKELMNVVPRLSLNNKEPENSDYCNFSFRNKDSYLLFTSAFNEDCYYSNRTFSSRNSADLSNSDECELCYECIDCEKCYQGAWLQNCSNTSESYLGYNLKNCQNCFGCFNLSNKKYYIWNQPYSKEDYFAQLPTLIKNIQEEKKKFFEQQPQIVKKYMDGLQNEECSGNSIFHSLRSYDCYEVKNIQDCRWVCNATNMKDAYDVNNDDHSELVYEAIGSESNYMHAFNDICWFNSFSYYNSLCFNSKYIFGCVGLKKNEYCILNKQYTKEQYEELVLKIIEHMKSTGEWGEFFPASLSPFSYNETVAQDYFPMDQEKALKKGFNWYSPKEKEVKYVGNIYTPPDDIKDVSDEITKNILQCENSGEYYKIIAKELTLYRQLQIPIPKRHPDQRYKDRLSLRNPRHLWGRNCMKCNTDIQTSYAPDRPEQVYCEKCYLEAVY